MLLSCPKLVGTVDLCLQVLPITLCAWLGFIVFFLDKSELAQRLQVIVTLFLSLTAVQARTANRGWSYVPPLTTERWCLVLQCWLVLSRLKRY